MLKRRADRGGGLEQTRKKYMYRNEVEALLPWPSPCGTFPEVMRHERLQIDRYYWVRLTG